jgi:glutaredoxin 3
MSDQIIVYTIPNCPGCTRVKGYLQQRGISYEECNLAEDETPIPELKALGFSGLPLIRIRGEYVEGFNREKLDALLTHHS